MPLSIHSHARAWALARTLWRALLAIFIPGASAAAQAIALTGSVRDETGRPLPNATVAIKAFDVGTLVRDDGTFRLVLPGRVPRGSSVLATVHLLGYRPDSTSLTVPPAGDLHADFTLQSNPMQLGEVVVTGLQTETRVEQLATARSTVDALAIEQTELPDITTALAAKAPNVVTTASSGAPGASTAVHIRGINTLGTNGEPLFVIDGVPIDNSATTTAVLDPEQGGDQAGAASPNRAVDINPDDIANIEILKGAAAAAIYGGRGAQGVILITTKRGHPGETRYSLHTSQERDNVVGYPKLQTSFAQGTNGAPDQCAAPTGPSDCYASLLSWGPRIATGTPVYNHADEIFRPGALTDNTLSIAGGSGGTTVFLSGGYLWQNGTVVGDNNSLGRKTVRATIDHKMSDSWSVGANVYYASTATNGVQKGNGNTSSVFWTSWLTPPSFDNQPVFAPDGEERAYDFPHPSAASGVLRRNNDNPFFSAAYDPSLSDAGRFVGGLHTEYRPVQWLQIKALVGTDNESENRLSGYAQTSGNAATPLGDVILLDVARSQVDEQLTAAATYDSSPSVGGTLTLGEQFNTRSLNELGDVGNSLNDRNTYNLENAATEYPSLDYVEDQRDLGFFGDQAIDLWHQVHLHVGLRYDAASTYLTATDRTFGAFFPTASVAWELNKLIAPNSRVLSYAKLRAAYGQTGTEPTPYEGYFSYQAGAQYQDVFYSIPATQGGYGALVTPSTEAARTLRPERTSELETGGDVGLFGQLADASATVYERRSARVIVPVPVSSASGYQFQFANAAIIQNVGTEFTATLRPIQTRNVGWDLQANAGANHNRVDALNGATYVPYGGEGGEVGNITEEVAEVGYPVGSFLDYDYVRCGRGLTLINAVGQSVNIDHAICTPGQDRGHALFINNGSYRNIDGSGGLGAGYPLIDPTPLIIGHSDPDWTAGFNSSLRLGNVTLAAFFDIRHGGLEYNGTRAALNYFGAGAETALRGQMVVFGKSFLPGAVAGPGAGVAVPLTQTWFQNDYNYEALDAPFYENAGFVKLRDLSLTYTYAGGALHQWIGFSTMQLRVTAHNLFTLTRYAGIDPEVNEAGSETGATGLDFFQSPPTRSFAISVDLSR